MADDPSSLDVPEDRPLRHQRDYVAWLAGSVMLEVGGGILTFALPLITLQVTGSVWLTGLVGLAGGTGALVGLIPGACSPIGATASAWS